MFSIKTDIKLIFLVVIMLIFGNCVYINPVFADNNQKGNDRVNITINETNLVKNSHVLIKDIAHVQANGFLKEVLDKIEIGRSPKPGQVKSFDKKKILSLIEHQQYLPENIIFNSPQQIYVKRESQRIAKSKVRQSVDKYLSQTLKGRDYQLKILEIRGLEQYPVGTIKLQIDSGKIINNQGKLSCHMKVFIDGTKEDLLKISGRIAVYENIFFAKKRLVKGDIISRECVYKEKKNIYNLREGIIKNFDEISGKMVKSSIEKNDYFKRNSLLEPPLIKKGDIISMVVKNDNLLIVASGISMENGFENQLIRVENIGSGKLVRAVVKGKSKVEVIY
ncbi:MAG: flagellar basal body P-ring formation protein FlgA [Desulfobacula sp.]|nr:flagellar basal body P-ring formation protein FlgA [Desulfobacula sp.]